MLPYAAYAIAAADATIITFRLRYVALPRFDAAMRQRYFDY